MKFEVLTHTKGVSKDCNGLVSASEFWEWLPVSVSSTKRRAVCLSSLKWSLSSWKGRKMVFFFIYINLLVSDWLLTALLSPVARGAVSSRLTPYSKFLTDPSADFRLPWLAGCVWVGPTCYMSSMRNSLTPGRKASWLSSPLPYGNQI